MTDLPDVAAALSAQHAEVTTRLASLRRHREGIVAAARDVATDDEHDPEGATLAFEREQLGALIEQAQRRLAELDDALVRLADASYGRCERCGQPIPEARLAARPTARRCVPCAQLG